MSSTAGRSKHWIWFLLAAAAVSGVIAVINSWTRDVQTTPPHMLGSVWTAKAENAPHLYYLMEEQRVERGYFDTDLDYSYMLPYSIFTLHARDARDGEAAAMVTIARVDRGKAKDYKLTIHLIPEPVILGPQANVLWLWHNGLQARDLKTLAVIWSTEALRQKNPQRAAVLPAESKYYRVLGGVDALVFKGSDARFYQIDPASGEIQPVDEAKLASQSREYQKTADSAFSSLHPNSDSLRDVSESGLMWTSFLDEGTGTWYGLLSGDERPPGHWKHPRYGFGPSGEVARSMYRAPYTLEESIIYSEPQVGLDPASASPIGDQRFLMGGFLRRPNTDSVWFVNGMAAEQGAAEGGTPAATVKGRSCLVLHRETLGENSPWHVTCIDLDGAVRWTHSTGLAEIEQLCEGNGSVVVTGYADKSEPTAKRPELLVFIDEQTGGSRTINLVSNEIAVTK